MQDSLLLRVIDLEAFFKSRLQMLYIHFISQQPDSECRMSCSIEIPPKVMNYVGQWPKFHLGGADDHNRKLKDENNA